MPAAMWWLLKSERSVRRVSTTGWVIQSIKADELKIYPSKWKISLTTVEDMSTKVCLDDTFQNINNKYSKGPSLTFNNISIHTLRCSPRPSHFQHFCLFNDSLTREFHLNTIFSSICTVATCSAYKHQCRIHTVWQTRTHTSYLSFLLHNRNLKCGNFTLESE